MADRPFEAIVETHHAEIYRYLRRVVSAGAEADDLVGETFLRAFRAHRSRPADADTRAWLFALATDLCRARVRSRRRRRAAVPTGNEASRAADGNRPDGEALPNEARGRLEDVIGRLPVTQRLAFTMRKLHDLDHDVIGASLDCSALRARVHVFRALRTIRRALQGFGPPVAERRDTGDADDRPRGSGAIGSPLARRSRKTTAGRRDSGLTPSRRYCQTSGTSGPAPRSERVPLGRVMSIRDCFAREARSGGGGGIGHSSRREAPEETSGRLPS